MARGWKGYSVITPQTVAFFVILWVAAFVALLRADLLAPAFWDALGSSLRRMAIGYSLVAVIGVALGILLGHVKMIEQVLASLAVAINAIPGAAWVPLSILWFGMTEQAVIFTILLGATGIVVVNTHTGLLEVPPLVQRAALTLGARGSRYFWFVAVPSAIPKIVDGLRLAWAFGWRALMAGELFTSVTGLGRILNQAAKSQQMNQLVAVMLLIAAIGVVIDGLLKAVQQLVRVRWGMSS